MKEDQFFKLEKSEIVIINAASRIFSAYIAAGQVTAQNETEKIDKAITIAINMARKVENLVLSDSEPSE